MIEQVGSQGSERRTELSDGLNPLGLRSGRSESSSSQPRASRAIPPNPTPPARSHYCHQPLSASLAASFAIHPLFLLSGALKATSSISFSRISFRYPSFSFFVSVQLGSTKPPTFRRSSLIRNPQFTYYL